MPAWIQAIIFYTSALLFLRLAGKRTISRMSPGEVVIMFGLGTVMVHPLKSENIWNAVLNGFFIVAILLAVSFIQIYYPKTKKILMGEPIVLVKNGVVLKENLKRSRMTVDELNERLRLSKVNDIAKVKMGTLEVGGNLGIEMFPEYSYATKKDIEDLKIAIQFIGSKLNATPVFSAKTEDPRNNLFIQAENVQEHDPLQ